MLDRARSYEGFAVMTYECADISSIRLESAAYDLVYSSLTLHYLPDVQGVFTQVYQSLRPDGHLVFSCEHPIRTAPSNAAWDEDSTGQPFWPLNNYYNEGQWSTTWLGVDRVQKYHRSMQTYVSTLLGSGFTLTAFKEFWDGLPTNGLDGGKGVHRPLFLMIAATKAGF